MNDKKLKKCFIDVETTHHSPYKCGVHQISMIIEVENVINEVLDLKLKPFPDDEIELEALKVSNLTPADLDTPDRLDPANGYATLIYFLEKYVDRFDKTDKMFFIGYNSHSFDMQVLRQFFSKNGDKYFGSWFFYPSIDVMILAAYTLMESREDIPNFKLGTIAQLMGVSLDDEQLHDALYDVQITRQTYYKLIQKLKG